MTNFAGAGMPKTRDEECECLVGNGFLGGLFGCHFFLLTGCVYVYMRERERGGFLLADRWTGGRDKDASYIDILTEGV